MNDQIRYYPNELRSVVDDRVLRVLEDLYNRIYQLSDQINQPTTTTIGKAQLKIIHDALQASGAQPLNVNGLLGLLSQPQIGGAPTFTSFPPAQDPKSQDGALGVLGSTPSILYRFSQTTRTWVAIAAAGVVSYLHNAIVTGVRTALNFIDGNGITLTVTDNGGAQRVDITIAIKTAGPWQAWTGTATRTTIATGAATATNCAEAIKALIDDLVANGSLHI